MLRGHPATATRLLRRGKRVSSVAAMDVNGVLCVKPAYSPDLNLMEELFSKIKAILRENDRAIQRFAL